MPNHVTNKILFAESELDRVRAVVTRDGRFDFETLLPSPPQKYNGGLSMDDEKDFPCNWLTWNRENWGTKWNAYQSSFGVEDGRAFIKFDTAWSVPRPVLVAFANRFAIEFEFRCFDEGHNFWGVELWGRTEWDQADGPIRRTLKRFDDPSDRAALCVELKGYDPDAPDEDDDDDAVAEPNAERAP